MKQKLTLSLFAVIVCISGSLGLSAMNRAAAEASTQNLAKEIIAREKASVEAWQRKDKAFWMNFLADDATYFGAQNPYLETDPKENFIPKFEMYADMFKIIDAQMYNPRVQVYGDVAILTYNNAATVNMGGQVINYTGKVTSVYVKQGGTWKVAHGHESMNPSAQ